MSEDSILNIALVIVRDVHFMATALVLGAGFLSLLPFHTPRLSLTLARRAALLAGVTGLAWFVATFVIVTGDARELAEPDALIAFWGTAFGPPWAAHLALAVGCAALGLLKSSRSNLVWIAVTGCAMAINQAWLGHAATGTGQLRAAGLASQAIHITAAYAWAGALPMLYLTIHEGDRQRMDQALSLFSTIGVLVVATILATGFLNLSLRLQTPRDLVTTPYGRIASIKIAMVAIMIMLAWINRALAASRQIVRLRRSVVIETILAAATLGAAAILGMSAPPA